VSAFLRMHCRGPQLRGPCPIRGRSTDSIRTFSVQVGKNIFRCFDEKCGAKRSVLDLWAAIHTLPLYDAGLHLGETFGLRLNREEEPVKENPSSREKPTAATFPEFKAPGLAALVATRSIALQVTSVTAQMDLLGIDSYFEAPSKRR
jgi:hypothetical protein